MSKKIRDDFEEILYYHQCNHEYCMTRLEQAFLAAVERAKPKPFPTGDLDDLEEAARMGHDQAIDEYHQNLIDEISGTAEKQTD